MNQIICVAGPTASGKTALAVGLAKALDGEVLSCDSMQVYRGMDIGTAKPTAAEMDGVVHHMLSVADPGEEFSVSRYVTMADEILQDILARGKTALITGGTGLYMDSLVQGREFAPPSAERALLEQAAREKGIGFVYDMLRDADPETAARLHLSDQKRIIRAMEVFLQTGLPISYHNAQTRRKPPKYRPFWLALTYRDRAELYRRIDARVDQMFAQGLVEEVTRLLQTGIPDRATALQAIGYKEIVRALRGELTLDQARLAIQQGSRRYAKRQLTWLRRNDQIHWILRDETPDPLAAALALLAGEKTT